MFDQTVALPFEHYSDHTFFTVLRDVPVRAAPRAAGQPQRHDRVRVQADRAAEDQGDVRDVAGHVGAGQVHMSVPVSVRVSD